MKLKDILSGKINEVRMTPGRVQKIQRNLQKAIEALKDNFPKYKAAKESGDEKKLKKHTKIALDLTKKKKELEKDLDKALGGLYADAELQLEASYDELQFVNKIGKDITKHLMDYLTGKIDKREFTKLSGLSLGFKNQVKLSEGKLNENTPFETFKTPKEAFDYIMDKRSEAMELEDQLRELSDVIIDTQRDMENDPEVTMAGSGASDKYGAVLNKYEEEHSMLRKQYNAVMAKIDDFDQRH